MPNDNGRPRVMIRLEVVILVVQFLLGVIGYLAWQDVRGLASEQAKQERRIDALEQFKAEGGRWTLVQQMGYERQQDERFQLIRDDLSKIKAKLGVE